jgi:outer membrane lipoprotein-sorting protein
MNETEENHYVRQMLTHTMPDDLPPAVEQRMRNRLTAFRERFDTESAIPSCLPIGIWNWIEGFTMRQRIAALGSVGVASLLGFLLLWAGIDARTVSAMEKMAEAIRHVKSCRCTEIVQEPELRSEFLKTGEPPPRMESVFTIYWLAPGSVRDESTTFPQTWKGAPERTEIRSAGKPGIIIDHERKTFFRTQPLNEGFGVTGCETLEDLAKFSGKADRELGTKEINGKKARGFQIDRKKIYAETTTPGTRDIWIDTESNLPVLVRDDMKWPDGSDHSLIIKDIQYNIHLAPRLFDAVPPEGYKDTTEKPLPLEEQVHQITKAMNICAEVFDGCYPAAHGDLVRAVFGGVKAKLISGNSERPAKMNTTRAPDVLQQGVLTGLREVTSILAENPDPAYNGKTVGPKDKDKVLLRWKLDDGRYEVIFGDLRAETVTAEKLRVLEKP